MISFYPGPSRVHDEIHLWVQAAQREGVLSMNHRSDEFVALSKKTIGLLKKKLRVPEDYTLFFTSSATECWEIIAQSLVLEKSCHFFNGAFGEKWFDYTHRLKPASEPLRFPVDKELPILPVNGGEIICITQNETSNGSQVSNKFIEMMGRKNPEQLIAVDATSSMGGIFLNFSVADIWFASVQKCFGLPAGLAIMICSPRAMKRMTTLSENNHYNSLSFMAAMMKKWQTTCTPNVLGIYLLMRVLKKMKSIEKTHQKIVYRFREWEKFYKKADNLSLFVIENLVRSYTVVTVAGKPERIEKIKRKAKKQGFLLGEGYGDLRKTTFRIANFPAIKPGEIRRLKSFLKSYL